MLDDAILEREVSCNPDSVPVFPQLLAQGDEGLDVAPGSDHMDDNVEGEREAVFIR